MLHSLVLLLLGVNAGAGMVLWSLTIRDGDFPDEVHKKCGVIYDIDGLHVVSWVKFTLTTIIMINFIPTLLVALLIKDKLAEARE